MFDRIYALVASLSWTKSLHELSFFINTDMLTFMHPCTNSVLYILIASPLLTGMDNQGDGKLLRPVRLPACCLDVGSVDADMSYKLVIMTGDGELLLVEANGSELSLAVAHVEFNGRVFGFKDDFF